MRAFILMLLVLGLWSGMVLRLCQSQEKFSINSLQVLENKHTCLGEGLFPEVKLNNIPSATRSYAITLHSIQENGEEETHMVFYDLKNTVQTINTQTINTSSLQRGQWGKNSINDRTAYSAPCEASKAYILTVYALAKRLSPPNALTRATLEDATNSILLEKAEHKFELQQADNTVFVENF